MLGLMLVLHVVHARQSGWTQSTAVGQFSECTKVPRSAPEDVFTWIKLHHSHARSSQSQLEKGNATVFQTLNGLYIWDRCWNPRPICELVLADGSVLLLPHAPTSAVLLPNKYVVLLGPAAAVGTNSPENLATLLEEKLGMPVVNLGRGGAGPHLYLGRSWAQLKVLLAMANAIVVITMSGRSSPNSHNPMTPGRMPSGEQNMHWIHRTYNGHNVVQGKLAADMLRESVAASLDNTTELLSRVRGEAFAAGRSRAPYIYVLWFSRCTLARAQGCTTPHKDGRGWSILPQLEFPHFIDGSFLLELHRRTGAVLVEAAYGHIPAGEPLKIEQCGSACPAIPPSPATRVACTPDEARTEMCGGIRCATPSQLASLKWQHEQEQRQTGRYSRSATLCPTSCTSVAASSQTYPPGAAHRFAAEQLFKQMAVQLGSQAHT